MAVVLTEASLNNASGKFALPNGVTVILVKKIRHMRINKVYNVTGGEDTEARFIAGNTSIHRGVFNGIQIADTGTPARGPGWTILTGTLTFETTGGTYGEKVSSAAVVERIEGVMDFEDVGGPIPIACAFMLHGGVSPATTSPVSNLG